MRVGRVTPPASKGAVMVNKYARDSTGCWHKVVEVVDALIAMNGSMVADVRTKCSGTTSTVRCGRLSEELPHDAAAQCGLCLLELL